MRSREEMLEQARRFNAEVKKYRRAKVIREEVVEAYLSPFPSSIDLPQGKVRQVEKGEWVVIREDGSFEKYRDDEFKKVFEENLVENGLKKVENERKVEGSKK